MAGGQVWGPRDERLDFTTAANALKARISEARMKAKVAEVYSIAEPQRDPPASIVSTEAILAEYGLNPWVESPDLPEGIQPRPDPVSTWQAALGRLQLEIPQEQFNTFLRPCSGLTWDEDCLVVGAATTFAVSWLELPLHLEMVREAVAKTTGAPSRVRYLAMPASRQEDHEQPA